MVHVPPSGGKSGLPKGPSQGASLSLVPKEVSNPNPHLDPLSALYLPPRREEVVRGERKEFWT